MRSCNKLAAILFGFFFWIADATAQDLYYYYDLTGNLASTSGNSFSNDFTLPPQLVFPGSPFTLSVTANGTVAGYQWILNGVPIPNGTNDSILLTNYSNVDTTNISVVIRTTNLSITSAPVALWIDSNENGMPDWWQMQYFGNLNQLAEGDYDGDGVANIDEYLEGTNPTNASSFNPRLYLESANGKIVASPAQPYYAMNSVVTLTAVPDSGQSFISWGGSTAGNKPTIALLMDGHKTVIGNFGLSLPAALDNTNVIWTTGGNNPWFGQTSVSEDGQGSAQSGALSSINFETLQSWLQGTVNLTQPAQMSFWWDVSSESPDGLSFTMDGAAAASFSGINQSWQFFQTSLPAGYHVFKWTYQKNSSNFGTVTGDKIIDAGWVDEFTLAPIAPQTPQPVLTINPSGTQAQISWPSYATGYLLQENSSLASTNWTFETNSVTQNQSQNQVLVQIGQTNQFFRLIKP